MTMILPDILLLVLGVGLMLIDLLAKVISSRTRRTVFHLAWTGLAAVFIATFLLPGPLPVVVSEMYRIDNFGLWMRRIFTLSAMFSVVLARPYFTTGANARPPMTHASEFTYSMIFCTLGMFVVVSACDLLTLFVGLELATVPLYILAAYNKRDPASAEAGVKYIMTGSVSTAFMLFSFSYLYGVTGTIRLDEITAFIATHPHNTLVGLSALFMFGGIGFKLAMVPFHMWAPDVYAGAPAPAAAFLSVSSKATALAFLLIMLHGPFAPLRTHLTLALMVVSAATMLVGNFGAMRQTRLLRFAAYSSIAQAGYLLMAFLGTPASARAAILHYLFIYAAANFAFFIIISIVGEKRGEVMTSLRGLSKESPSLAAMLAVSMFSLAGIPPAAGFIGKFMLFAAAAENRHYGLIIFAALNATASLYYYLLIIREAYIVPPDAAAVIPPLKVRTSHRIALAVLTTASILLGLLPTLASSIASSP